MKPSVVEYQTKKETLVTKNELCKMYSDIEKNGDNWNKIRWFFHENVLFLKFHDFSIYSWNFLGQIPGFTGDLVLTP